MTIEIYTCYHKQSPIPKCSIMIPMHVGKEISSAELNIIGDNTGDNISSKNKHFCELTATYWIWKNSAADIIGLFHYRRFFNLRTSDTRFNKITSNFSDEYGLTEYNIQSLMKDNDIILPKLVKLPPKKKSTTVYEHYTKYHVKSDMDCVLNVVKEKYPQMVDVANRVIKEDRVLYGCNMLVTKKELFDEYAAWLFDILFEVEKRIHKDVLTRDAYQQRVYGFLSERMMRIFIEYKKEISSVRIKEVPTLYLEEDPKAWKRYKFKRIKYKVLKLFGIKKDE